MYDKWLADGLAKPGKDAKGLAKAIRRHASTIYKIKDGKRKIAADELHAIAAYIEEPVPYESSEKPFPKPLTIDWRGHIVQLPTDGIVELAVMSIDGREIRILAMVESKI